MATKIGTNYLYSGKGPFDVKQLVSKYADLVKKETFGGYQYNGMVVGVAYNQSTDVNTVGIYYLHDSTATSGFSPVDNTKEENWHKLGTVAELNAAKDELSTELQTALDEIEKKFKEYDEAIEALTQTSTANSDALAALVAQDTGKSIRDITKAEIASQMIDRNTDLGGLVVRIGSAEDAIKALEENGGGISEDGLYSMLSKFEANVLIDDSDDIIVKERQLTINRVGVSKLYADIDLVLHGGSAKA